MINIPKYVGYKRLVIRRLTEADTEPFVSFMTNTESTKHLLFNEAQKTRKGATEMIQQTITSYKDMFPSMVLAISLKEKPDVYIGSVGAAVVAKEVNKESEHKIEDDAVSVQIFYTLLSNYTGHGYATEAVTWLIEHLLADTNDNKITKVIANISPENIASIKLAKRANMQCIEEVKDYYGMPCVCYQMSKR